MGMAIMAITRPDPQDLWDRISNNMITNVLGGSQITPESLEHYVVANDYAAAEEFYSLADQMWRERDPRYACCENLIDMASIDGVYPNAAKSAQGYVKITGTAGAKIPNSIDFVLGGQNFRSIGTMPSEIPASGDAVIRVKALKPSADTSIDQTTGTISDPIEGIDSSVVTFGSFCGGADAEECEAFRSRYIARRAYKPKATHAWLMEKIMEWPCVTRVMERAGNCCDHESECGCAGCGGALEFYAMFDGTFECGIGPQCVIDDINEWLFGDEEGKGKGRAPIGVCGLVYTPEPATINVAIDGLACATSSQKSLITERIEDVFKRINPSEFVSVRPLELAIAQVLGTTENFNVLFRTDSEKVTIDYCGNLDPDCDVLPCLGEITFINQLIVDEQCL